MAVAAPSIQAYAQIVDKDGEPMGDPEMGAPTYGANWLADDDLNPFDLAAGRAPEAADEVVIDQGSAKAAGYQVGDDASVLTQAGEQAVTIVGIATFGGTDSPGGASFALFTLDAAETYLTAPGKVDAIKVVAADGVSDEQVVERIAQVVPDQVEVLTGAEITAEDQSDIKEGLGFFNTFLLTFALIALFVGSFIIYNSFSILVAQRGRDMALLRAIGASRRQVLGSVLLEAVVVGLIASVVGLAAGVGVASGLKVMLDHDGDRHPRRWHRAHLVDRGHLADRRARREHRLGAPPGSPGQPGGAGRRHARRRRRQLRQQPPPGRHRHRGHRPRRRRRSRRASSPVATRRSWPSASAWRWCSSAWPCSVRSWPGRSAGRSARRCPT